MRVSLRAGHIGLFESLQQCRNQSNLLTPAPTNQWVTYRTFSVQAASRASLRLNSGKFLLSPGSAAHRPPWRTLVRTDGGSGSRDGSHERAGTSLQAPDGGALWQDAPAPMSSGRKAKPNPASSASISSNRGPTVRSRSSPASVGETLRKPRRKPLKLFFSS